jgi:hypothetical protein
LEEIPNSTTLILISVVSTFFYTSPFKERSVQGFAPPADVVLASSELGKSLARGDESSQVQQKPNKCFVTWIRNP